MTEIKESINEFTLVTADKEACKKADFEAKLYAVSVVGSVLTYIALQLINHRVSVISTIMLAASTASGVGMTIQKFINRNKLARATGEKECTGDLKCGVREIPKYFGIYVKETAALYKKLAQDACYFIFKHC